MCSLFCVCFTHVLFRKTASGMLYGGLVSFDSTALVYVVSWNVDTRDLGTSLRSPNVLSFMQTSV